MKSLTEYIKESMLKHIAIELYDSDIIYEKFGLYDGCSDLAKFIINKIKNHYSYDKEIIINYNEVKDIDNVHFDKMIIRFDESDKYGAKYIPFDNQEIISGSDRFNEIHLQINKNFNYKYNEEFRVICHELTHIYNDYLITIIGRSTFYDLFSSIDYQISKDFNRHDYPSELRKLLIALYMLDNYERNGFIASLSVEIEHIKERPRKDNDKPLTSEDIYKEIKELDIYKAYMEIIQYIEYYKQGELVRKEREEIVKYWKEIFDEDLDIKSVFNSLCGKITELKRKLESTIPKKIAEKLDYRRTCTILDGECISDLLFEWENDNK